MFVARSTIAVDYKRRMAAVNNPWDMKVLSENLDVAGSERKLAENLSNFIETVKLGFDADASVYDEPGHEIAFPIFQNA